ncbi:arsenical efflux pump membrane protein ArsB [Alicyclobacillus sp.]|uniref:arsenical efflux pump membrane protein ArsB n=1 Tax=Alicyclobacillus sp. TaxID=61169 RepID=UPI0025BA47DD|nr:arsenical efflux pump membrane protein ArsB [Alicyclobacillus sp.]MCL6517291.1 arsenical efflux pump membrane protein ArsB [Alicyclobacillus sp.]
MEWAGGLFLTTLVLILWRPRGLGIGWTAAGAAGVALVTHLVTLADVVAVARMVWDATLAFIAAIVLAHGMDRAGFFDWAAIRLARAARGDGRRVFLYVMALGAATSAVLNNDGAILILTPVVLEKIRLLRLDARRMLPFVMASGFVADTTSLPLVISNLVNILSADSFHIGFIAYAARMILPDLVSFAASAAVMYLWFRRDIPRRFEPSELPDAATVIRHRGVFRLAWGMLALLVGGDMVAEFVHVPVSAVAWLAASILTVAGVRARVMRAHQVAREAPWSVIVFSIGMYLVVDAMQNAGLTSWLERCMAAMVAHGLFIGVLGTGFLAALLSSVANNLPATMLGAVSIHALHLSPAWTHALAYANVIGCDLGPKMTPVGSLVTLLWLHVLRREGIRVTALAYMRLGVVCTVPVLITALLALYLVLRVTN